MRQPSVDEHRQELIQSVRQFLDTQSSAAPIQRYCLNCGSLLAHLTTRLWMEEVEEGWIIALPYCANCHPAPELRAEQFC
jgi:hypothetical protein